LLEDFRMDPLAVKRTHSNKLLWEAQTLKRASTNADTGEIIPRPFRLCGFVTYNMPILVGLLLPNPSTATVIFWQWANQSHNAAINYCNRNASNATDYNLLYFSYGIACVSAISVAQGIRKFINTRAWDIAKKQACLRYTSFPSVVVANTVNMCCMRSKELMDGIEVKDTETNESLGHSKVAAKKAVFETALSRVIISAGVLFIPPLIDNKIQPIIDKKYAGSAHLSKIKMGALCTICAICFYGVLPVSVAPFEQYKMIEVTKLEKEIQEKSTSGVGIYNRGQ